MDRLHGLEERFAKVLPEDLLIRVAARGLRIGVAPDETELGNVFENIQNLRPLLLFPWFWTHRDVTRFSERFQADLTPDHVFWYLLRLLEVLHNRRKFHWMERVNLFHAFGLARLVGGQQPLNLIEQGYGYGRLKGARVATLTDMSAYNVLAMLRESGPIDAIGILRLMESAPPVVMAFGRYQIYYYGGLHNLLITMRGYLRGRKAVVVPQSAASLLALAEFEKTDQLTTVSRRIYDEILPELPDLVISAVEHLVVSTRSSLYAATR